MSRTLNHCTHKEDGSLLIELIVAVAIVLMISVASASSFTQASRQQGSATNANRMTSILQSVMEQVKSENTWADPGTTCAQNSACDLSYMFNGTGTGNYAQASSLLTDSTTNSTYEIKVTARRVDSVDDGTGTNDHDNNVADYFTVVATVSPTPETLTRFSTLKPMSMTGTVDPRNTNSTGSLTVRLCQVTNQIDERIAIETCPDKGTPDSIPVRPPVRWSLTNTFGSLGFVSADQQAYACAHPDYANAPTPSMFATQVPGLCYSAEPPYSRPGASPSYRDDFQWPNGQWFYYVHPDYPNDNDNLPVSDRYKYVSMRIQPVQDAQVTITGPSGTFNVRTNTDGIARFDGLLPGNYTIRVTDNGVDPLKYEKWRSHTIPGDAATVNQGVETTAIRVYKPRGGPQGGHIVRISIRNTDNSFPWSPEESTLRSKAWSPPKITGDWNPAWGDQDAGNGHIYRDYNGDPFVWDAAHWGNYPHPFVHDYLDGGEVCVILRAAPLGRVADEPQLLDANGNLVQRRVWGSQKRCEHATATRKPEYIEFTDLEPGLYSAEVTEWGGFQYGWEHFPGFIWVDENGTTKPSSGDTYSTRARITWKYCSDVYKSIARRFDPTIKDGTCYATLPKLDEQDSGSGSS